MKKSKTDLQLNHLGKFLLAVRLEHGWTQNELARRSGIVQSTLSQIEVGRRLPTLRQLLQLAQALDVSLQRFLTGSNWPGKELSEIAIPLRNLGVVDLHVEDAVVPAAFQPVEEVIALAVSGKAPEARIVEALPAVLAWNRWDALLLQAYAYRSDPRSLWRLAWLADIALTIHGQSGFPGGCVAKKELGGFLEGVPAPQEWDALGRAKEKTIPPVSRRWQIAYPADLETFQRRAEHLHHMRQKRRLSSYLAEGEGR